jgi:hypothetical protein
VRVRDVEIALVLAREMKDAAARDVDASLRLEQLKEVFGADQLDAGERARIQTALQMAGLEPRPSLLEAGTDEPIRFEVSADEAAAAATPARPAPAEQRQEFPTVGEFTRSTFRRFRDRRKRKTEAEEPVVTATELPPEPVAYEEPAPEPEPEPVLPEEPEPEPEPTNGHVDVVTNGNGHHIDLLDEVALPPHDTATPADFGASAETMEYDDPRLGEEWAEHQLDDDEEDADADADAEEPEPEPALVYPEEEPEYAYQPEPVPEPVAPATRVSEVAAVALPLAAIPVLVASLAGWSFGLPFVALALITTGVLVGRRGGFFRTLRESEAARTVAKATAAVTFASLGISIVLANVGGSSSKTTTKPAAKVPTTPVHTTTSKAKTPATTTPKATKKKPRHHANKPTTTTPATPAPDPSTKGLILVPPSASTSTSTTPQSSTSTTPAATPGQPVPQGQTP